MKEGIVVKGIGGFYYVSTEDGVYTCKAKGSFKKDKNILFVGDHVKLRVVNESEKEGFVSEIKERKNVTIRPPMANIDRMIIISSVTDPAPDTVFIDKMITLCEHKKIEPVLCFNKIDLSSDLELISDYEKIGYKVIKTSALEGIGTEEFKNLLIPGITAVAGFSGVGKSSLLSSVMDIKLKTGKISDKIQRGKHTTRHVELFETEEGKFFADTPGFSSLEIDEVRKEELPDLFIEFEKYSHLCRFSDCSHTKERDCGVITAVENGEILKSRHNNYVAFYDKLKLINEWEREK